jgi:hypothetical protein
MPEALLLVLAFAVGGAAGAAVTWFLLRPPRQGGVTLRSGTSSRAGQESRAEPESHLASASRELLSELETRYQGRTATGDEEPKKKRAPRRRTP